MSSLRNRKKYIQALESMQNQEYFLAIANTSKDMIHIYDHDGRIIYANLATEKILGYDFEEINNIFVFDIIHPDDRKIIKTDMTLLLKDGEITPREIRLKKETGTYIDVELSGFLVIIDKDRRYLGAIIRDITVRKKAERELDTYRNNLEQLVEESTSSLQKTLDEVKTLRGILPICSFCKQIRDDGGYWNQVETYVREHAGVEFSHSLCPDCAEKHYPRLYESYKNKS